MVNSGVSTVAHVTEIGPDRANGLASRLSKVLDAQLRSEIGESKFGLDSRLVDWRDALIAELPARMSEKRATTVDLRRLAQPDTGPSLALNSFLPWLDHVDQLRLGGESNFNEVHFDTRCPTGVRGTPPQLELIALGPDSIAAVTARSTEYLQRRRARLAAAYDDLEVPQSLGAWHGVLRNLQTKPGSDRYVDSATLLKFAIGLARTFPRHRIALVYLFLEPTDAADLAPFAAHRAEVRSLVERSRGTAVQLHAMSFGELWDDWTQPGNPEPVRQAAARLKRRYSVTLAT